MHTIIRKYILAVLLFSFSITSYANRKDEAGKHLMQDPYEITKRSIDSSLAEGKSKFIFTFYDTLGLMSSKKQSIQIGFNNSEIKKTPNSKGNISYVTSNGKYKLAFYIKKCYEIFTDTIQTKNQEVIEITVRFARASRKISTVRKPVIYLYPKEKMNVEVKVISKGNLTFTYPNYNQGWKTIVSPNGNLEIDGKNYNYLFWESEMTPNELKPNSNSGFLVSSDTLLSFLENSLNHMGLTSKESADFITYWYPQMQVNEKNYVSFLFNEECNAYAELNITPKPDHLFRVGMLWSKTNSEIIPSPQVIQKINREGFIVVEWGGTEMDNVFEKEK